MVNDNSMIFNSGGMLKECGCDMRSSTIFWWDIYFYCTTDCFCLRFFFNINNNIFVGVLIWLFISICLIYHINHNRFTMYGNRVICDSNTKDFWEKVLLEIRFSRFVCGSFWERNGRISFRSHEDSIFTSQTIISRNHTVI